MRLLKSALPATVLPKFFLENLEPCSSKQRSFSSRPSRSTSSPRFRVPRVPARFRKRSPKLDPLDHPPLRKLAPKSAKRAQPSRTDSPSPPEQLHQCLHQRQHRHLHRNLHQPRYPRHRHHLRHTRVRLWQRPAAPLVGFLAGSLVRKRRQVRSWLRKPNQQPKPNPYPRNSRPPRFLPSQGTIPLLEQKVGRRRRGLSCKESRAAIVGIEITVSTLVSFQRNVCGPSCPQRLCASFGQFFCPTKRCRTKSEGQSIGKQAFSLPPADCAHGLPSFLDFHFSLFLVANSSQPTTGRSPSSSNSPSSPNRGWKVVRFCLVLAPSSVFTFPFFLSGSLTAL